MARAEWQGEQGYQYRMQQELGSIIKPITGIEQKGIKEVSF